MKKQLVILGIAVLLICVGLSGCTEQQNTREWTIDVISTLRLDEIADETPKSGYIFLVVNINVINAGNERNNIYAHMIETEDMENREYSHMEHYIAFHENVLSNQYNLSHFDGGYLEPDEYSTGYVIYEVPDMRRAFYVDIKDPTAQCYTGVFSALGDIGELTEA